MRFRSVLYIVVSLLCVIYLPSCLVTPEDPTKDPENASINLFVADELTIARKNDPQRIGIRLFLPKYIDSVYISTSCESFSTSFKIEAQTNEDTLYFNPVFLKTGSIEISAIATLLKDGIKDKTDKLSLQVLPADAMLSFSTTPSVLTMHTGKPDTVPISVSTESVNSISFSVSSEPSLDEDKLFFIGTESDDSVLLVLVPDVSDTVTVTLAVSAKANEDDKILKDTSVVGVRLYSAPVLVVEDVPEVIIAGSVDTLLFVVASAGDDNSSEVELLNSDEYDVELVNVVKTGSDTLMILVSPQEGDTIIFTIKFDNGITSDTLIYEVAATEKTDPVVWDRASAVVTANEGNELSIDLKQYLLNRADSSLLFSASEGEVTNDVIWKWMPQWGSADEYSVDIITVKEEKKFKLTLSVSVVPTDVKVPSITLVDEALDGRKISSPGLTLKAVVTDENAGVDSVIFFTGIDTFEVSIQDDSIYSGAVTGFKHGVATEITISAIDKSMSGNRSSLTISVTYDSTIQDAEGPQISRVSGPKSGDRVTGKTDTLTFTIEDNSQVDSTWWKLNGYGKGSLKSAGSGKYSLVYSFDDFRINRIVVFARDNSTNENVDSAVTTLDYNTRPVMITPDEPEDGAGSVALLPTFTWTGGSDEDGDDVYYRVQYGTAENSLSLQTEEIDTRTITLFENRKLSANAVYFWRVIGYTKTYADTVRSSIISFRTLDPTTDDETGPNIIRTEGPASDDRVTSGDVQFAFTITDDNSVDTAYVVINGGDSEGGTQRPLVRETNGTFSLQYTLPQYGSNELIVHAVDGATAHNQSIETITLQFNTRPGMVTLTSPIDNATGIPLLPDLFWSEVEDDDGDEVFYRLYLGSNPDHLPVVGDEVTTPSIGFSSSDLEYTTVYYWKIAAYTKTFADTSWSPVYTFTTRNDPTASDEEAPVITLTGGPGDGDRVTSALIEHTFFITDDTDVDTAYVVINDGADQKPLVRQSGNFTFSYTLPRYYSNTLVIHAIDKSVNANASTIMITLDYNTEPGSLTLESPEDRTPGVSTTPTFEWTGGNDQDGDDVTYSIYCGTAESALSEVLQVQNTHTAQLNDENKLNSLTRYFARVMATSSDYHDVSSSAVHSFITDYPQSLLMLDLHFENNIIDRTSNGYTISCEELVFDEDHLGRAGGALSVDDSRNSYLEIPHHENLNFVTESFTISFWVKALSSEQINGAGMVAKGRGEYEQFALDVDNNQVRFWVRGSTRNQAYQIQSGYALDGEWHKITAVMDQENDSMFLYADTAVIGKRSITVDELYASEEMITIGARPNIASEWEHMFSGSIADFRIYQGAFRGEPYITW